MRRNLHIAAIWALILVLLTLTACMERQQTPSHARGRNAVGYVDASECAL